MKSANGEIFICAAKRTAIGSFGGSLSNVSAVELASHCIKTILETTELKPEKVNEVILGCVLTAGTKQAPARQAALFGGLPNSVQAMAINKVCSSGLKAVMLAADKVALGHAECVIAGGMESMSRAPYLLPTLRNGARLGSAEVLDSIIYDALWDVYNDFHMGNAAELCAKEFSLSREDQDKYAHQSYTRALNAANEGWFKEEIAPINVKSGREEIVFDEDEEPKRFREEKIPTIKPAFDPNGTVTAINASSINDGAAAMIVCTQDFASKNGLTPLARIVSQGWNAQEPEWFTTAPVGAANAALEKAGLSIGEIDLFEINEAFSAVSLACASKLDVPADKLNVCGGAVALGHPVGASGARILTTLLYSLKRTNGRYGLAAICNGGGEATSVIVERI